MQFVKRISMTSLLLFYSLSLFSQNEKVPKNFPGLFGGIEWNTVSGSWGIEYERFLYARAKFTIGAKLGYISKYQYGNFQIISSPSCCESASQALLLGTVSYYTGSKMNFSGLFIHSGVGVGLTRHQYKGQVNIHRTVLKPAFEIGPGWQFRIGEAIVLRCKGTAAFGPFEGSFTSSTISLGF